jgi:hypothetical protein
MLDAVNYHAVVDCSPLFPIVPTLFLELSEDLLGDVLFIIIIIFFLFEASQKFSTPAHSEMLFS